MSKYVASGYTRKVPLLLVLVVPFVLQIFAAVGLTGWVSLHNGQKAVTELTARLREEATERVAQGLRQYLESSQTAKFISIAEETGLIIKIDAWVLHTVCCQMKIWRQFNIPQNLFVTVNFSGKQLLQPDLVEQIDEIISSTSVERHRIKLEITESTLINHHESTKAKLEQIQNLGISLIIDDFGTGYSSLNYLHQFPFSKLKIDYSFISRLTKDSKTRAIVEAIILLAHKLEMDVVAEGVETIEQLEILQAIGCQQIQGNLFSAPLTSTQATAVLKSC